jgi:hypothetical protein
MNAKTFTWRPSSALVVTATATLVLATVITLNWLNARRARVNAHVEIAAPQFAPMQAQRANAASQGSLPDGEVERLALRVREVSALLLGLNAVAANHQLQHRSLHHVEHLLNALVQAAPLPPGLERVAGQGAFVSKHATIYVRYRPQPFGLEIVSVGRELLDGPAVLGRMDAGAQPGAWLFIARKITGATIPAPFAPLEQVIALNWQSEPLREREGSAPELAQLQTWAESYAVANR